MRTTVEMKPAHRKALLALAADRGEKGFSGVLADAIEVYLEGQDGREKQLEKFRSLRGSLSDEEAEDLRARIRAIREHWR
ncbi:MAG TPA: hypothetical protein VLK33_21150 [Terriglobales bacterium]|nr:hypothetical protein [Terriglobales bacterium]